MSAFHLSITIHIRVFRESSRYFQSILCLLSLLRHSAVASSIPRARPFSFLPTFPQMSATMRSARLVRHTSALRPALTGKLVLLIMIYVCAVYLIIFFS